MKKFIVMAFFGNKTFFFTKTGWVKVDPLMQAQYAETSPVLLTSEQACKVRDDGVESALNEGYNFTVMEVEEA